MTIADFKKKTLVETVRLAGKLTNKEHGDARVEVCRGCEYAGLVKPLKDKDLEMPGCTKCGCPFATKPYMLRLLLKKITCPHPEGNKWAAVDKEFLNQKTIDNG